jgi:hypothetical protein
VASLERDGETDLGVVGYLEADTREGFRIEMYSLISDRHPARIGPFLRKHDRLPSA